MEIILIFFWMVFVVYWSMVAPIWFSCIIIKKIWNHFWRKT